MKINFLISILFSWAVSPDAGACIEISGTPVQNPGNYQNMFALGSITATFTCPGTNIRWTASGVTGIAGIGESVTIDYGALGYGSRSFGVTANFVSNQGAETSTSSGGWLLREIQAPNEELGECYYGGGPTQARRIYIKAHSNTNPQTPQSGSALRYLANQYEIPDTSSESSVTIPLQSFAPTLVKLETISQNSLENEFGPYEKFISVPACPNHAPVSNLGADSTTPYSGAVLNCESHDQDGDWITEFSWSLQAPPGSATTIPATTSTSGIAAQFDVPGSYIFSCSASDGNLSSAASQRTIVYAPPQAGSLLASVHIGQIIEDPDVNGDGIVDIVDGKTGFAILRLTRDLQPLVGVAIENLSARYGPDATPVSGAIFNNVTDGKGQVYVKFSPFVWIDEGPEEQTSYLVFSFRDPDSGLMRSEAKEVRFVSTRKLRIGYSHVSGCSNNCYASYGANSVLDKIRSHRFLSNVYPIPDSFQYQYDILPSFLGSSTIFGDGVRDDEGSAAIIMSDWNNAVDDDSKLIDSIVFLVPDAKAGKQSYYQYNRNETYLGLGKGNTNKASALEGYWTAAAHEVAHNLCVRFDGLGGNTPCVGFKTAQVHTSFTEKDNSGYFSKRQAEPELNDTMPIEGFLSGRWSYMKADGIPSSEDNQTLFHQWSDRPTYRALLSILLDEVVRDSGRRSPVAVVRVGFSREVAGSIQINHAIPDRSEVSGDSSLSSTEYIVNGWTKAGALIFTLGANRLDSVDEPENGSPGSGEFEVVVPNALSLDRITIEPTEPVFRQAKTLVLPLEVLRTQLARVPDGAYLEDPTGSRAALVSLVDSAIAGHLSGDRDAELNAISEIRSKAQSLISGQYLPRDGVEIGRMRAVAEIRNALSVIATGSISDLEKRNAFFSISKIGGRDEDQFDTYLGRRQVSLPNNRESLALRSDYLGRAREVSLNVDGTFILKVPKGSHVEFKSLLRNGREANALIGSIEKYNTQAANLKSILDSSIDEDLRDQIEAKIASIYRKTQLLSERLRSIERIVGEIITFD